MVDWKHSGILAQLRDLDRQQERLELLLAPDVEWQAHCADAAGLPSAALRANPLFKAREGVINARDALREMLGDVAGDPPRAPAIAPSLTARAREPVSSPESTPESAPERPEPVSSHEATVGDAFRTRLNVKPRPTAPGADQAATTAAEHDAPPEAVDRADGPLEPQTVSTSAMATGLLAFLALPRHPAATNRPQAPFTIDGAHDAPAEPVEPEPPPPAPAGLDSPANDDEPGRLDQIRGMQARFITALLANGVTRCRDIANWSATDVARFKFLLGRGARISEDQWIEQAAILASGTATRFARHQAIGYFASVTATGPDHSPWLPHRYDPAPETVAIEKPRDEPRPEPWVKPVIPLAPRPRETAETREAPVAAETEFEANVRIVRAVPGSGHAVAAQTTPGLAPLAPFPTIGAPPIDEPEPVSPQRYETAAQEASVEIVRPRLPAEPEPPPRPAPAPDKAVMPARSGQSNPISRFLRALTGE